MFTFEGGQTLGAKAVVEKLVVRRVLLKLSACLGSVCLSDKARHSRTSNTTQVHDDGRTALHRTFHRQHNWNATRTPNRNQEFGRSVWLTNGWMDG
jgi:hypothetical protein